MLACYHYQLGIPQDILQQVPKQLELRYGAHAQAACYADRYGVVPMYDELPANHKIIECECEKRKLLKVVYRVSMDEQRDVCLAVNTDGFVRTVWINMVNDVHKTLNINKYRRKQ